MVLIRRSRSAARWLAAGLAAVTVAGFASDGRAAPAGAEARLKHDTQVLSSDAFEGRAPMSAGEEKTVDYIARAMRDAGLKPALADGYLQTVPMVQLQTLTTPAPRLGFRGKGGELALAYGRDVTLNTRRNVHHVGLAGSEVVFVGYGVTAPERHWDDYAGVDVRGKTVLTLINDPDWRNPVGQGPFGGAAMTYYGRWMYKYEEAARHGAAAAIIIHNYASAGYPFSVLTSSLSGSRVSLRRSDGGAGLSAVEAWITHAAAERALALAGEDLAALEREAARRGFRARAVGLKADFDFDVSMREGVSHNVAGVLPGSRRPDEYVLYTAHWDHLGRCPADAGGDNICNGAIDNATGVAALLELARGYARRPRPARSILFLATTGEEYGLLGSEYYAAHPAHPLARTVAEIDIDPLSFMLGRTRDVSLIADQTELAAVVRRVAARQGRVVTPDPAPELGSRYRSDTLSFARAGLPIIYAQGGVDVRGRPAGWGRAKLGDYFDHRYHQPSDTYDPDWDWSGALEDLALYDGIGRELADSCAWPNWYPTDEFRAARDRVLQTEARSRASRPRTARR